MPFDFIQPTGAAGGLGSPGRPAFPGDGRAGLPEVPQVAQCPVEKGCRRERLGSGRVRPELRPEPDARSSPRGGGSAGGPPGLSPGSWCVSAVGMGGPSPPTSPGRRLRLEGPGLGLDGAWAWGTRRVPIEAKGLLRALLGRQAAREVLRGARSPSTPGWRGCDRSWTPILTSSRGGTSCCPSRCPLPTHPPPEQQKPQKAT